MEWVEIPAHRILVITMQELREQFTIFDETGEPAPTGTTVIPYRVQRDRDRRMFKPARYWPIAAGIRQMTYVLEEA